MTGSLKILFFDSFTWLQLSKMVEINNIQYFHANMIKASLKF